MKNGGSVDDLSNAYLGDRSYLLTEKEVIALMDSSSELGVYQHCPPPSSNFSIQEPLILRN